MVLRGFSECSKGSPVFIDPSAKEAGPSYALIRSEILEVWLDKNDLQLIWLIGGEKQLFTCMASKFYGRLVYSGIYTITNAELGGEMWFIEEPGPNDED